MDYVQMIQAVAITGLTGFCGYAVTFINKMKEDMAKLRTEIEVLKATRKCKCND